MKKGKMRIVAGCLVAILAMNILTAVPAMAEEEILVETKAYTAEAIEWEAEPEEEAILPEAEIVPEKETEEIAEPEEEEAEPETDEAEPETEAAAELEEEEAEPETDEAEPEEEAAAEPEEEEAEPETDEAEPEEEAAAEPEEEEAEPEADAAEPEEEAAAEPEEEEAELEAEEAEAEEEAIAEPEEEEAEPETDEAEAEEEAAAEPEEEEAEPETDEAEAEEEAIAEPEEEEAEPEAEETEPEEEAAAATLTIEDYVQAIINKYHTRVINTEEKTEQLTKSKEVRTAAIAFENGINLIVIRRYVKGVLFDEQILDNGKAEAIDESIREYKELLEWQREMEEKARIERELREAKERAEREAQEEIDRQVDAFRKKLESADAGELLDLYNSLVKEHGERIETGDLPEDDPEEEQEPWSKVTKKVYERSIDLIKESVTATFKLLPGGSFFGGTAGKIIGDLLGINDDEKTDLEKVIKEGNAQLQKDLLTGFADTKDSIDNFGTLKSYGAKLDNFTEFANRRAKKIKDYLKTDDYSELEKMVWIANLIGRSDEWYTGANNGNIMMSMYAAAEVFRGEKNEDSRDLYNVIFDMNKQNSLFTGEAMVKSQDKIEAALGGFLRNCQVVTQCLKAHEAISHLTQEEIDSLEPQTRAIYDQIHTHSKTVMEEARCIMGIFLGDKEAVVEKERTGIFEKAEEFYRHDRTVYIDHGHNRVDLAQDFKSTKGVEYFKELGHVDSDKVDHAATASGLTKEDLEKIIRQAKASRMTIREYLEACGFTVNGYYLVVGARTDYDIYVGGFYGNELMGYKYQGLAAYNVDKLDPEEEMISLAKIRVHEAMWGLEDCDDHNNNHGLYNLDYETVTFQTK